MVAEEQMITVEQRAVQTLTMPWHTWKHQPVAGDLIIVYSTKQLVGIPYGWTWGTANITYETNHNPKSPDPQFSSYCDDDDWYLYGCLSYPVATGEKPCLKEGFILIS
jgi:hypothetical protein